MTIRVVLAEDNFLLREGVRGMLAGSESIDVVGSCGDLTDTLAAIDTLEPDVVLTDIRMPPDRRDEGILIAGFGNVVHNLGKLDWKEDAQALDWAKRFSDAVRGRVATRDHQSLVDYAGLGDDARLAVPTPEHYLPLLYILGLQNETESSTVMIDGIQNASISMLSIVIGGGER